MADKHHSGKYVKTMQKNLMEKQMESLGMDSKGEPDFSKSILIYPKLAEEVGEKTLIQNGRIDAHRKALDKNSKIQEELDHYEENNNKYLEIKKIRNK